MSQTDLQFRPGARLIGVAYLGVGLVLVSALAFALQVASVVEAWHVLVIAVGGALLGATLLRSVSERIVSTIGVLSFGLLGGLYVGQFFSLAAPMTLVQTVVADSIDILSGGTLLQIHGIVYWLVAVVVPAAFLAWYFLLRGAVVRAILAAGSLIVLFTLAGDLPLTTTLLAISGGIIAIGATHLHRHGGSLSEIDSTVTTAAIVVVVSLAVFSIGGAAVADTGPGVDTSLDEDEQSIDEELADSATALEQTLGSQQELQVTGSVSLEADPRFVVETDEPTLFRTEVYNRYTGEGWVRTDGAATDTPLPEGDSERIQQEIELLTSMESLPTAGMPVRVSGLADEEYLITPNGRIQADEPLSAGTQYSITAERQNVSTDELVAADGDYPDPVLDRYTQLPSDIPDRVGELTAEVTADAETPYESARLIETYLAEEKEYSLEVPPPEENIADQFLFEMDAGYCTYYATTMAVMLRSEGIPARVVSGYNAGHSLEDETRVVLAADAHAWVEVYIPDTGWVTFDPTPATDWQQARLDAIEEADLEYDLSQAGETGAADNETQTPADVDAQEGPVDAADSLRPEEQLREDLADGDVDPSDYETSTVQRQLPASGQTPRALLWGIIFLGVTTVGLRLKPVRHSLQPVRMSYQRRRDPTTDLDRARNRIEWLLSRRYRPRRPTETPREYLSRLPRTVDPRVEEFYTIYEQVHYGGTDDPATIDRAVSLVNELIREQLPVVGRLFR